jgi:hypothetical protein
MNNSPSNLTRKVEKLVLNQLYHVADHYFEGTHSKKNPKATLKGMYVTFKFAPWQALSSQRTQQTITRKTQTLSTTLAMPSA